MEFRNLTSDSQPWSPIPFPPVKIYSWERDWELRAELQHKIKGKGQYEIVVRLVRQKFNWIDAAFEARGLVLDRPRLQNMVYTTEEVRLNPHQKPLYQRFARVAQLCHETEGPISYDTLYRWCKKYQKEPYTFNGELYNPLSDTPLEPVPAADAQVKHLLIWTKDSDKGFKPTK